MTTEISALIQQVLDSGDLLSPVVFDGVVMTADTGGVGVIPPVTYDVHGWSTNLVTDIGGRRSKNVDALIAELTAAGNTELAAYIPEFHISRFYAGPCVYGFAVQDNRFGTPADYSPLTTQQFGQALHNLVALNNKEFLEGWSGGIGGKSPQLLYRGVIGSKPFDKVNLKDYDTADWRAVGMTPLDVVSQNICGAFGGNAYITWGKIDPSKHYPNHNVYDAFFDTQTDANVARYWRAFAVACGANIPGV